MNKLEIVGLSGLAGSGKGECSLSLRENLGFTEIAFADKLKSLTSELFALDINMLRAETPQDRAEREEPIRRLSKDGTPRSGRWLLQEVGNKIRTVYPEVWVEYVGHKMISKFDSVLRDNKNDRFVIPDVRYQNEFDFINSIGGTIIDVQRGEMPYWVEEVWHMDPETDNEWFETYKGETVHKSEWSSRTRVIQNMIPYVVLNNGTLADLEKNILALQFESKPTTIDKLKGYFED